SVRWSCRAPLSIWRRTWLAASCSRRWINSGSRARRLDCACRSSTALTMRRPGGPSGPRTPASRKRCSQSKATPLCASCRSVSARSCEPIPSNPTTLDENRSMKGSIGKIMQQAQEMQGKMQEVQTELEKLEVTGESGAGLVKVTMTGKHEVRNVDIDPSVFEEDRDLLEDLMAAAINDAVQRVTTTSQEKMSEVTGGLNLPPGMNLPF